jgi:hypothetical protein
MSDVEDIPLMPYPPIARRMVDLGLTMAMENAEKGDVSEGEYLRDQVTILGSMLTAAVVNLEIKLNKLIEITGYEWTDKT